MRWTPVPIVRKPKWKVERPSQRRLLDLGVIDGKAGV